MDRVFFRVYHGILTHVPRGIFSWFLLITMGIAILNTFILALVHVSFVGQEGCGPQLMAPILDQNQTDNADIIEIKLSGWWTDAASQIRDTIVTDYNGAFSAENEEKYSNLFEKVMSLLNEHSINPFAWDEFLHFANTGEIYMPPSPRMSHDTYRMFGAIDMDFIAKKGKKAKAPHAISASELKEINDFLLEISRQLDGVGSIYRVSNEKGLLLLSSSGKKKFNVTTATATLAIDCGLDSADDDCHKCIGGGSFLSTVLNEAHLHSTVVFNAIAWGIDSRQLKHAFIHDFDAETIYHIIRSNESFLSRLSDAFMLSMGCYVLVTAMIWSMLHSMSKKAITFLVNRRFGGFNLPLVDVLSSFTLFLTIFGTLDLVKMFMDDDESATMILLAWTWGAEVFGSIFARSRFSIRNLPIVHFACLMSYLLYCNFFSIFGFKIFAGWTLASIELCFAIYCIVYCEFPALLSGRVSIVTTRETYAPTTAQRQ